MRLLSDACYICDHHATKVRLIAGGPGLGPPWISEGLGEGAPGCFEVHSVGPLLLFARPLLWALFF